MAPRLFLGLILGIMGVYGKGDCESFFGALNSTDMLITVSDVDVFDGFPYANETFVHYAGPGSECISPAPPKGCHRYYRVTYSPDCLAISSGLLRPLSGTIDTQEIIDRASGVIKGCGEHVINWSQFCYGAPAEDPIKCNCP
ncbi:hypothetical protein AAMO2058_000672500 [Amorphochlora amoebiformis]